MTYLPPTSRPQRTEPALGCTNCFLFKECGGIYEAGFFDCLPHCCNKPATCTLVCPRSKRFIEILRDTGGLALNVDADVRQRTRRALPLYVPVVHHGFRRARPLGVHAAALPGFRVMARRRDGGEMFETEAQLRSAYMLSQRTRVILSCIDEDSYLENYWRVRCARRLPERLAQLGLWHIIAPNFSLPVDVPRFDNIANIRRSLICAEELSGAGLSVIPYVAGVTEHDWDFWGDFLREHKEIKFVAKEFQTGGSNLKIAEWHVAQLLRVQDKLGRGLHIVAVGGRRLLRALSKFSGTTLINADAFMKAQHRMVLSPSGR